MMAKALLGRKEDKEMGYGARPAPQPLLLDPSFPKLLQAKSPPPLPGLPTTSDTVTINRRINISMQEWAHLQLREISQRMKKEIQTKGNSIKNSVPWLLWQRWE